MSTIWGQFVIGQKIEFFITNMTYLIMSLGDGVDGSKLHLFP